MLLHLFLLLGELPDILIFSNINVCGHKIIASKVTQTDKTHLNWSIVTSDTGPLMIKTVIKGRIKLQTRNHSY